MAWPLPKKCWQKCVPILELIHKNLQQASPWPSRLSLSPSSSQKQKGPNPGSKFRMEGAGCPSNRCPHWTVAWGNYTGKPLETSEFHYSKNYFNCTKQTRYRRKSIKLMRRNAIDGEQDRDVKHGVGDIWVKNKSICPHTCSGLTGRGDRGRLWERKWETGGKGWKRDLAFIKHCFLTFRMLYSVHLLPSWKFHLKNKFWKIPVFRPPGECLQTLLLVPRAFFENQWYKVLTFKNT